jgi:hypothetical protein
MGLLDKISSAIKQSTGRKSQPSSEQVETQFDQISPGLPRESLASGVTEAFRSPQTPPFGQLVSELFRKASPQERSGMMSALLSAAGPPVLSSLAGISGSGFSGLIDAYRRGGIAPEQAAQITPEQVEHLASRIEQHNPAVVEHMGAFFSQHPDLLKTLGSGALGTILSNVERRKAA